MRGGERNVPTNGAGEVGVDRGSEPVVVPFFLRAFTGAEVRCGEHAPV